MKVLFIQIFFIYFILLIFVCYANGEDVLNFSMEDINNDITDIYNFEEENFDTSLSMLKINDINTSYNRNIYKFTSAFIQEGLSPIIIFYKNNVPRTIGEAIVNFILNTKELNYAVNHVLQGNPIDFGVSVTRFAINSVVGFLGFIDISDIIGIPRQKTSFDVTLESWGVGSGSFVMLPLLGGGTVRSFTGGIIDNFVDPFNLFILPSIFPNTVARAWFITSKSIVYSFITISDGYDLLVEMEKSSIDPYSTFRNYYLQNQYYKLMQHKTRRAQNRDRILRQFLSERKTEGYQQLSINGKPEKQYSSELIQNPLNFSMEDI